MVIQIFSYRRRFPHGRGDGSPAVAADPWFTPYEQTAIPNGSGPGPAPRGSAVADFDNDGDPDLVTISNFTMGNILYVPNTGNGTFGATSEIADTVQVQGLDAGDVNGDGNADVVAMTVSEVRIRLGDGAGHFTAGGTYPLTLGGRSSRASSTWTATATSTSWLRPSPRSRA